MKKPTGTTRATPVGHAMVEQLTAAHRPLRSDVAALRAGLERLRDAMKGSPADGVQADVRKMLGGLTVASATWQLQSGCQFYCQHLSLHHTIEDQRMLPVMAREFPELRPTVARLRRDHEEVLQMIRHLVRASDELDPSDITTIERVHGLVVTLADHLDRHLEFEEESLFPYFRKMKRDWHHG